MKHSFRPSLTELANQFGSDKGTIGPSDNWQALNYTDVYDAYLEPLRDQPIRLLEIGIGATGDRWDARIVHGRNSGGASIKMWEAYFPKADIAAIDINHASYLDNDRVQTFVVDQSNAQELRAFISNQASFDVIIDDGSHHPAHQQLTLSILFPKLNSGGLYIIEDLDDNGKDDPVSESRSHSMKVLNTRTLLKSIRETDTIKSPHAFAEIDFLDSVNRIDFHCPELTTQSSWQYLPPRKRTIFQYRNNSERVCVLRKA
ncbi:MAG: hypothetical protein R8G66_13435 [Cytophagales bacterium]|nr:hypothetical protein [Cytophagales bacterium]